MKPENLYIPYYQAGETDRTAAVTPVDTDLSALSDRERALAAELSAAADCMNPLYRHQFCRDTEEIHNVLSAVAKQAGREEQGIIEDYLAILTLQNSPWSFLPRKNHLLKIPREALHTAARKAGVEDRLPKLEPYFYDELPLPDKATFYPPDLSEEDLETLGSEAKKVNTRVTPGNSGYEIILNEDYYRDACNEAAEHLKKARELTDNVSFRLYLDAKIEELATGSEEARRLADYHWIRHDSPIDIVLSTAIEVYLDNWKNFKGTAGGVVTVENRSYRDFLNTLLSRVRDMEQNAPWTWRRDDIPEESLPKLKYVDVINWSGEYISSPMTVLAQSLPNDEWVGKHVGTVNMVYINTSRALFDIRIAPTAREFFPADVYNSLAETIFDGNTLHSALHEIGHTTGRQDPDHQGRPSDYLGNEYSALEETRAELFGMWAADYLHREGLITEEQGRTAHYYMLLSMVTGLRFEPVQAHNIARNIIFHNLKERGAIIEGKEEGRTVFSLDFAPLGRVVEELLATIANLKASGDREGFIRLRETYSYTDPMREEVDRRLESLPLGTGLIFPHPVGSGTYPAFTGQPKFLKTYAFGN